MNTVPASTRRAHRRGAPAARLAGGLALAGALVLGAPLAASAHVGVTPVSPVAGGSDILTFSFSHGCDDSPTTALEITIPEGLDSAIPTVQAGWSVDVARNADSGVVETITYTADEPIESGLRAAVDVAVTYAADASGTLAFPVEQTCVDGSHSWSQIAEDGEDPHDLDEPAPVVTLAEGEAADAGTGHSHGASDDEAGSETADAADDAASASTPVLPTVLGAGGLVLGAAALAVSVGALRRARR